MENNKKKQIILVISIIILLISVLGVTFAVFSYSKVGSNEQLITGDIYMHYKESNQLLFENAIPSDNYTDGKYFEFSVDGKNTNTKYDVWYEILLNHGDNHETRTERLQDKFLRFSLFEIIDNEENAIFSGYKYDDIVNKKIWVDKIDRNTTSEVSHRYRLYVYIGKNIKVGNQDTSDYSYDTWNNQVYASVKVTVNGDFTEKSIDPINTNSDCYTYNVIDETEKTISITGFDYNCDSFNGIIPSTINGYTVKSIANNAFKNQKYSSMIIIPDGVIEIGASAFENSGIQKVVIPGSVESLTQSSFAFNKIKDLTLNEGIKLITYGVFRGNKIKNLVIPDSVKEISYSAFDDNPITNLDLGNGVETLMYTFVNDNDLGNKIENLIIPDSVTGIYGNFKGYKIKNLTIGNGTKIITNGAFSGNDIENVTFGNSLETISNSSFSSNKIKSVTLPNSMIEVSYSAFSSNPITSVNLGTGLKKLLYAFGNNGTYAGNEVNTITIPDSLIEIGSPFNGYKIENLIIGNGLETLTNGVFQGTTYNTIKIKNVIIGDNVKTITNGAFQGVELENVTLGSSVETISVTAFENNQLKTLTLPNSITTITGGAFANNQLTNVVIPSSVNTLTCNSFDDTVEITYENSSFTCTE